MNWPKVAVILFVPFLLSNASAQPKDKPGAKDPELFSRIPGFSLIGAIEKQFDSYEFSTTDLSKDKKRVEGRHWFYEYLWSGAAGTPVPSNLQIIRNYQNAAARLGGKKVWENREGKRTTILIAKGGRETWVDVVALGGQYQLHIVDQQAMQQDVVASAAAFQSGLAEQGHVEVPGIFFDFGKAEVKPESEPALQEVTKLLQANPALKIWVVGHTDNVGTAEANLKLSADRAAAVIRVLAQKMSVDAKRMAPFGAGPYSPIATNTTEDGRAKNRRVELVAQP